MPTPCCNNYKMGVKNITEWLAWSKVQSRKGAGKISFLKNRPYLGKTETSLVILIRCLEALIPEQTLKCAFPGYGPGCVATSYLGLKMSYSYKMMIMIVTNHYLVCRSSRKHVTNITAFYFHSDPVR